MMFHEKLKRLCEDRKMTAVSRRAGLPSSALTDYIAKGHTPRADTALRIARALSVSVEWLIDDSKGWPPVWGQGTEQPLQEREEHPAVA